MDDHHLIVHLRALGESGARSLTDISARVWHESRSRAAPVLDPLRYFGRSRPGIGVGPAFTDISQGPVLAGAQKAASGQRRTGISVEARAA